MQKLLQVSKRFEVHVLLNADHAANSANGQIQGVKVWKCAKLHWNLGEILELSSSNGENLGEMIHVLNLTNSAPLKMVVSRGPLFSRCELLVSGRVGTFWN